MTAEEELIFLREQNSLLLEQVKQLQEQRGKDSHNSSLPPSSDRFVRQNHSWLRVELAQTKLACVFGFGDNLAESTSASLLLGVKAT